MSGRPAARLDTSAICRKCDRSFAPTAYQARNSAWICRPCQAAEDMAYKLHRRAIARAFIADVNGRTACADCAAQPVEWHNPEHVELNRRRYRIGNMVANGRTIAAIKAELARCTPLCRRCHMREDGRLQRFKELPRKVAAPPRQCSECPRFDTHIRLGLCSRCWFRAWRQKRREARAS